MASYLSRGANVVLFVVACFLAARTANAIFAALLTPPEKPAAQEDGAPPVSARPTWEQRQVIVDRNLFHSSEVEVAAPLDPDADLEATKLPLDLLGTAAADDPQYAWAAVLDKERRETLVVTLGDVLKEKATVDRIERRRLVLVEDGERRELTFGDEDRPASPVRRAGQVASRGRSPVSPRTRIGRDEIEEAVRNPTEILKQARFQPKLENGEMLGIQVNAIRKGSVLEDVGLENGDLITGFNGIPIEDAQDSGALLQELAQAEEISLEITREDGGSETISVPLSGE